MTDKFVLQNIEDVLVTVDYGCEFPAKSALEHGWYDWMDSFLTDQKFQPKTQKGSRSQVAVKLFRSTANLTPILDILQMKIPKNVVMPQIRELLQIGHEHPGLLERHPIIAPAAQGIHPKRGRVVACIDGYNIGGQKIVRLIGEKDRVNDRYFYALSAVRK